MTDTASNITAVKELLHTSDIFYAICVGNDGRYTYTNEAYTRKFKAVNDTFIGQEYWVSMHEEDMELCQIVGYNCYKNPGNLYKSVIRKRDGNGGYIATKWESILDTSNEIPMGIFAIGYDITGHEHFKTAIQELNESLDRQNKLLNAIAYEQSYMMQLPLENMGNLVNSLQQMNLGAEAGPLLTMLQQSCDQLSNIIKNSKAKTGR